MTKPRALDLFCGAGGATRGLQLAGFHVTGVDHRPQPRYVGDEFHQADALTFPLEGFDLIWASPPCQAFTQMSARWRGKGGKADSHPNLLAPMIARLSLVGTPWAIENVVGARHHMRVDVKLHGGMFGLRVHRPRLFMTSFFVMSPRSASCVEPIGVYGARADGRRLFTRLNGNGAKRSEQRAASSAADACAAMGIDWPMDWDGVREAVPPAYSQHIATYALMALGRAVA